MLSIENLEEFTSRYQTDRENVVREYCQHLFLSYLYQLPGSERLLFKGGTALRIVFRSPRFSEDLDFTGINITQYEVEALFTDTLSNIEKTTIPVEIQEGKPTTGGYLGIATFHVYAMRINIQIEVSLRRGKAFTGALSIIQSEYLPQYSIVHLPIEDIIHGKLAALIARHKPRDFYDYFFLLSGNYPLVKERAYLDKALQLLKESKIDFRLEIKNLLPRSHAMHLKDFRKMLEQKIVSYRDAL